MLLIWFNANDAAVHLLALYLLNVTDTGLEELKYRLSNTPCFPFIRTKMMMYHIPQDANLSPLPALTNSPLSPEMKVSGERKRERERGRWGRGMARRGGEKEEHDFAALLADLVQSSWCCD